ncbi:acVLRF1 family peptidyl-tRNA hydrolase [Propionibacteriaceae bacterium Y1685]|uniref:acVLRF1 family peptidyl-tRNA hydrolase n=1 Tax=Microlunatus sp. Y1700 TaxID=3418487 RepID=UPI003B79AC96
MAPQRTVLVPRRRLARWLDNFALRHGPPTARLDGEELLVTAPDEATATVLVPYGPVLVDDGADTTALLAAVVSHVTTDRRIGVLLARRGGHAAGVFVGEQLIASKVGSNYVQGRTKAGGWSQQRYARRRANQAKQAFADAADDAVRVLTTQAGGPLDALLCGGDREACEAVLEDPRLNDLGDLWQPRVVHPVPDPRLRVLQEFIEQGLSLRISLNEFA